jgi:hypothetical protein
MADTLIPHDTITAYLETNYEVVATEPFTLKVGETSDALLDCHQKYSVANSCFITACNPLSQLSPIATNTKRQAALRLALEDQGFDYLDGAGEHPSNQWPPEPSFLVLGLDLKQSRLLGARFEQNGIVWNNELAIPQLVLLR